MCTKLLISPLSLIFVTGILLGLYTAACEKVITPVVRTTSSPTVTVRLKPTSTPVPTGTNTPTLTFTPTNTSTLTQTPTPTITPIPTNTPIPWAKQVISLENTGRVVQLALWGKGAPEQVAEISNGDIIAVRTSLGIYLYRAEMKKTVAFISGEDMGPFFVSPGSDMFASTQADGSVKLWNAATGELLHTLLHELVLPEYQDPWMADLYGDVSAVAKIAFSPDSQLLAIGYGDEKIGLWRVNDGKLVFEMAHTIAPRPSQLAFSHDNQFLVSCDGRNVGVWDVATGELLKRIPNAGHIGGFPFSPDNKMLITSQYGGVILVWNFSEGELIHKYGTGLKYVSDVKFSEDGDYIIVNHDEQLRRLYDGKQISYEKAGLPTPQPVPTLQISGTQLRRQEHYSGIQGLLISKEQEILAWGSDGSSIFRWNVTNGIIDEFDTQENYIYGDIIASSDGKYLLYCLGEDLQKLQIGTKKQERFERCKDFTKIALSERLGLLARGWLTTLEFLNFPTGELVNSLLGHNQRISALAFSPDNIYFASGSENYQGMGYGEIIIWKTTPPERLITLKQPYGVSTLAFTLDNRFLASGGFGKLRLWRVGDGWLVKYVDSQVSSLVFSPDSRLLAVGEYDGTIRIWDTLEWEELAILEGHSGTIKKIVFSADGTNLLTASDDGTIRLWGVP